MERLREVVIFGSVTTTTISKKCISIKKNNKNLTAKLIDELLKGLVCASI